jgi:hypothetical protein
MRKKVYIPEARIETIFTKVGTYSVPIIIPGVFADHVFDADVIARKSR